jgi:hypothetical protein
MILRILITEEYEPEVTIVANVAGILESTP